MTVCPYIEVVDPHAALRALTTSPPPGCTCDAEFFPTAVDVDCPLHGLLAVLRESGAKELGWRL